MAWRDHVHYAVARRWLEKSRHQGWATCPLTQASFVRLSMQPAIVGLVVPFAEAVYTLRLNLAKHDHHFWSMDYPLDEMDPEIQGRIRNRQEITDAILLDLAIRRSGRLVTSDRRIAHLLPPDSPHRGSLEVIETE